MSDLDARTFDFYAAAAGATTPEDEVAVYLDSKSAHALHKLEQKLDSHFGYRGPDETEDEYKERIKGVETEIASLREKLKSDKVTVSLKGLTSAEMDRLRTVLDSEFGEGVESPTKDKRWAAMLLASHIVKMTDSSGAVDNSKWDADRVEQLMTMIPQESTARLLSSVQELVGDTQFFAEAETSPDFW